MCSITSSTNSPLMAIDVALVPPAYVQDRAREINRTLAAGGFVLDSKHIPHITLAQLFVMKAALPLLIERISLELRAATPLTIRALAVVDQHSAISYLLDRTPELLQLHVSLMDGLKEWEEDGGDAEAFYSEGEPARDKDVSWVANFRANAGYRKFVPHITLGNGLEFGKAPAHGEPFDFVANQIGLYQLGRFCTCRVLLHEWDFG